MPPKHIQPYFFTFIKRAVWLCILLSVNIQFTCQIAGHVTSYPDFMTTNLTSHRVDVWLPSDYSPARKYAVLYCQDGQNLFDTATNAGHQEWCLDETAERLIATGKTKPFIAVGVWSIPHLRHAEYFPEKAIREMPVIFTDSLQILMRKVHPKADLDTLLADEYLKFLVTEIKPFIDSVYSTKADKKNTFIMGSSSGGLLALYGVCEYPEIFGGAACLSTHFTGIFRQPNNPFPAGVLNYFESHHPRRNHKLYFDTGTVGLDSLYLPHIVELQRICLKEYGRSKSIRIKTFIGAGHNENAWAARLEVPLLHLLGKSGKLER